ncbi:MAG TPA: NAD(+) synthetase [Candidatus Atribacteria bacterium]|nr:NAD(+) synthetase [Candidatus Atribacteria bacterium]
MKTLTQKLSNWIENKVISAKAKGVVIGLSGGIDSAVVAILCKKVFPDNTLALIMPCHSISKDIEDAVSFAEKYDIYYKIIDLSKIYDSFISLLDGEEKNINFKLEKANIKPRLRMITLYYFANKLNYIVVGTGNKSELTIGYFTKYGDGGVDILPLGNLLKSQVVELAEYLEIPQEIIQKPPSAGLWEGQTDEAEIGISYKQIDEYLRTGKLNNKMIEKKIQDKINKSAHKRTIPEKPTF